MRWLFNWRGRKGQSTTEYIIIVVIVAVLSIAIITIFGKQIRSLFGYSAKQLAGHSDATPQDMTGGADDEVDKGLGDW